MRRAQRLLALQVSGGVLAGWGIPTPVQSSKVFLSESLMLLVAYQFVKGIFDDKFRNEATALRKVYRL